MPADESCDFRFLSGLYSSEFGDLLESHLSRVNWFPRSCSGVAQDRKRATYLDFSTAR